ncbi:hypothetical protein [Lysinibacillus odysseyi]|uniref:Aspartyl/asparaginyl-tRNA synthetase n=1 Tax=Lysinibacillus odysseyi 34hs-1 = NBRC 100172 TaxID=1220589 RepID=A0A0A3IRH2_9BACI|nr:hypothetical protein [Lysinibacillus odysseyi]KGR86080.1 aspartyl/asparaginyl-tRNA synthetase [Lysinibacillus odysseyi 34hs-1 = NBRC 100172]
MNEKVISLTLVTISSLLALYFVIVGNFELAVLFLTIMFTFTNFFRYRSFQQKGMEKEAKWMRNTAFFFGLLVLVVLYIVVAG